MNTIRRTKKTAKRNEKDFYQTNPLMVKVLLNWMNNTPLKSSILDPCCGKGVISEGLKTRFKNVTAFDKFEGETKIDFLEMNTNFDVIVMNPPYSDKYRFIDHARKLAESVFCLLPLNISNYNMFHREYEDIPEFLGKIVMAPKMFLNETTEFRAGGTASYAWYYWERENNTDYSKNWYDDLRKYQK